MASSHDRGRLLEDRIAAYFGAHGYGVAQNRVIEGRSGGRHEVDVLAEKSDGVTNFRVAVECKAWEMPIDKDVVSKLSYVVSDLGLNKGIVVTLRGWRSGAEVAAAELGIDLWGPGELERHLGTPGVAGLRAGPVSALALGYPFVAPATRAMILARAEGRAWLGMRTVEELVGFTPAWVPAYLLEMAVMVPNERRRREHLTATVVCNLYEAVSG
ncbi:MAG: restriction endonuclease, partial [Acidimicrobiales bacterium]